MYAQQNGCLADGCPYIRKGCGKMITIETTIALENYNKVFDFLAQMDSEIKDGKLFESYLQFEGTNWSFVIYPPDRVAALYEFAITIDPELQKAYDEQLSLLETCTGDYKCPQYIALAPSVDVYELKKKWCHDYCRVHDLALSETDSEGKEPDPLMETGSVAFSADAVNSPTMGGAL